jgi:hypothetical protein
MARGGVRIPILAEFDPAGIKKAEQSLGDIAKTAAAAFATTKIVEFGREAINAAADMGETISKAGVLFGDAVGQVEAFAEGAAASLGQSKQEALDAAATFATFGKAAGLTGNELANFSTELTALASDIGSFQNADPSEVVQALGAALRGEAEPMRRFGVLLDDATMRQKALELGIIDTVKNALTPQQKILAAQALIFEQTGDAQGDFARTSDSLANQQRILAAEMKNVQAELGQALLPVMKQLAGIALDVLGAFQSLPEPMQKLAGVTAIAGGAFLSASKTLQGLGMAAGKANKALGAIGLLIGGAVAVYGLYNSAKKQSEQITNDLADALQAEADGHANAVRETLASTLSAEKYQKIIEATGVSATELANAITGQSAPAIDDLRQRFEAINDPLVSTSIVTARLREEFGDQFVQVRNLLLEVDKLSASYDAAAEQVNINKRVTEELTAVDADLQKQIEASTQEAFMFGDGIEAVTVAMDEQAKATAEATAALSELMTQTIAMFNEELALENQIAKTEDTIREYALGIADGTLKGRDLEAAMRDVRSEALKQADAAVQAAQAQAELAGETLNASAQQRIMVTELAKIADALDPSDPLRSQLVAYIRELGMIPEVRETVIRTIREEIVQQSIVQAQQFSPAAIAAASRTPRVSRNIGGPVPGIINASTPIMAHGGEYVLSADVVDAIKRGAPSRGLGRGGAAGGGAVIINVAGSVVSERDLVESVRRGLLQSQRNGRQLVL